jgi:PAS domain S-box-containing protein
MIPRPYRFGLAVPLVVIPLFTFVAMCALQWLKHLLWPHIDIWSSHLHTVLFITAVATVGGFLACRYLEARSLLASIVESSDDAIVGIKLDGTILSWNRGAEKIYGYSAGEVVGQPSDVILPFNQPGDVYNVLARIRRGELVEHYETTFIHKDARRVHVDLTVSPILNAAGQIIGASTISRDITARKEGEKALRQSEIQLARTCAFSLVMVAHVGLDGRWLKVPPKLCELLGYSEEEMLALRSEDVTYHEDLEEERNRFQALILGRIKSLDLEKRYVTRDGRLLWVYLNYSIVTDIEDHPQHFLAYIRDITTRRMEQEELKQTNIYLENVFQSSPDAIGIVDEHGRFIKWNKMAAELYGYSFEELHGKSSFDLYADRGEMEKMLESLREHGSVQMETMMKRKDGSAAPFEIAIGLLRDPEGKGIGSVSVARDLSEIKNALIELRASNERLSTEIVVRKRAEEEVKRLSRQNQLILDAAGEGIAGLDPEGKVIFINPAGARLAGYKPAELINKDFHMIVHHSRPEGAHYNTCGRPIMPGVGAGAVWRENDEAFCRKDGTCFPVAYSSTAIVEEGRVVGTVVTFRDITASKLALEELNRYRDRLEDLVRERTAELAIANEHLTCEIEERKRAEEALRENSQKLKLFAYSVVHDLKSPAIGIHGFTQRLYSNYHHVLDEKGKIYSNQILRLSEHIAALVEQVNVFIATKETPLALEHIELKSILRTLRDEFSARLSIRQIEWLEPECTVHFWADRLSILRVFRNLIDNALKYGGDQLSKIWMGYEESEDFHIFEVGNDGAELKEMDSEKLFDPFKRQESSKGTEGSGLGLTIVKEIAERHGGTVWVTPGCGHEITFHLSISKTLSCF